MNILVACEESQRVASEFRKLGHEAYSCDIIDCSGGHPEWHIKEDVLPLLGGNCSFTTCDGAVHEIKGKWDMIIAFPPCTYLTVSANKYYETSLYGDKARERQKERYKAIVFFMHFALANCDRIAIENPIGVMNSSFRKPDQIIQPYEYGEHARKATCLWLKGLPKLQPTNIVDSGEFSKSGSSAGAHADGSDENGKWLRFTDPELKKLRSKTFLGVAKAMAEQWGK